MAFMPSLVIDTSCVDRKVIDTLNKYYLLLVKPSRAKFTEIHIKFPK